MKAAWPGRVPSPPCPLLSPWQLTFIGGEKRTEVFIHSLELGHSAATRAIKASGLWLFLHLPPALGAGREGRRGWEVSEQGSRQLLTGLGVKHPALCSLQERNHGNA